MTFCARTFGHAINRQEKLCAKSELNHESCTFPLMGLRPGAVVGLGEQMAQSVHNGQHGVVLTWGTLTEFKLASGGYFSY